MTWKRGAVVVLKWLGTAVVAGVALAITETVSERTKKKIDAAIGKPNEDTTKQGDD